MGFFNGGRFNLTVSLRYMPQPNEIAFLCDLFNRASRSLHDATDGTHSIGTVLYAANNFGGADASIWVHPNSDVWPNSTSARLWLPTESTDISQDFLMRPTIMAHELSHYLYDLLPAQRFELVLDRSGSMAGAKFNQLKIGANFWVDYVNPIEELGLSPMREVPPRSGHEARCPRRDRTRPPGATLDTLS
ncbi:hypothetical protein AU252_15550 [Pseudarthrobacter sulfonivorans]|uniref:Uncharacterized protein n=1 Tax=Pseudarthrobacter sulfonivorans TaxID=121292 RepID=A0A0U3QPV7_9MICC|nr:hypothetical protein AU252_15550 [Pseudarthrobacter sulfonivorans]